MDTNCALLGADLFLICYDSTSYRVYIPQLIRFGRALTILLTSTLAINCLLRNFLNKFIGIIHIAKHFLILETIL